MERYVDLREISDGKSYRSNDMVRTDCNGCFGCAKCCETLGIFILLDPYDCFELSRGLSCPFDKMMQKEWICLHPVDKVVLPALAMKQGTTVCCFLDGNGRCGIHAFRPGICRMFPLGRLYDAKTRSFSYFMQKAECPYEPKTKVKVEKWIGVPSFAQYERYIGQWHFLLKDLEARLLENQDAVFAKNASMAVLNLFFRKPYDFSKDFYGQFFERYEQMRAVIS